MNSKNAQLELMRRCLDGEANGEEFAQMEELLRKDAEFRKDYLRYLNVDSALAALPKDAVQPAGRRSQGSAQPSQEQGLAKQWFGWAAAAVAMLSLAGVLIYQAILDGRDETPPQTVVAEPKEINDEGVAVLTRVAGLRGPETRDWRVGETIPPGSMTWEEGLLQLEFYGGATVVVEGPAEIEVLDESRVICRFGRLRAHVPDQARGFTVLAPSFELVDLGTEFGLDVTDDGAAEVHVFDGRVELYEADSNRSQASRRELNAGDAVTVDRDGISKPIASREADFVTPTRLSQMTDAKGLGQLRDWRAFRDSLEDDPRVVAYFPFDKSDAKDRLLVGHGANGSILTGAIVGCEWSEGRWSDKHSLQFKRPGDRVRIEVPGEFESLTYSTWLRVDGLDRPQHALLLTDGYGKNSLHWQIRQDGNLVLGMRHSRDLWHNYQSGPIFNLFRLGQWVHLASVYDSDQAYVTHYVNGELTKRERLKDAADGLFKIGKATIGNWSVPSRRHRSSVRNFNGCIDELIIFNQALDAEEVRRIYQVGRP